MNTLPVQERSQVLDAAMTAQAGLTTGSMGMVMAQRLSEAHFLKQVTELADLRGWRWMHLLPGQHGDSWRTTFTGSLGKGWPDLVLVRGEEIVFLELKSAMGHTTPAQEEVLAILSKVGMARVYRPNDWDLIEQVLR